MAEPLAWDSLCGNKPRGSTGGRPGLSPTAAASVSASAAVAVAGGDGWRGATCPFPDALTRMNSVRAAHFAPLLVCCCARCCGGKGVVVGVHMGWACVCMCACV